MDRVRSLVAFAWGLLLLLACHPPVPDTPVASYLAFLKDVRAGDSQAAYQLLSSNTRQALEAQAKRVEQASGGSLKGDPAALLFHPEVARAQPDDVQVVKQEGDSAVLKVSTDGGAQQIRMVREQAGWKIDLTPMLG